MSGHRFLISLVSQCGAGLGTLAAIAAWDGGESVRWLAGAVVLALIAISTVLLISEYRAHRAKRYPTAALINRFMHTWISQSGRTAVFSNDMTWVSGEIHLNKVSSAYRRIRRIRAAGMKELLVDKARADELFLCLPRRNALSDELSAEGATVWTYEELGLIPKSRFTIVRYGQQGASVAIGRTGPDDVHQIEKFNEGHQPAFALASDLVDFARRYNEMREVRK